MTSPFRTRLRTRLSALLAIAPLTVALAGCGTEAEPRATDPDPSSASSPSEPDPSQATTPPAPTESGSATPDTVAVPLYFVGDTPQGPRLFREFQNVEADNPVDEALALLSAGDALDPDYSTLVPGPIREHSQDEGLLIELTDPGLADRPEGMDAREAELAIQQVVYTVQGIEQQRIPITFVLAGGDSTTFLGTATPSGGFTAAKENKVLALVNVTEPAEGALVSGSFMASGLANSFEATVPWQIRDGSGQAVLEGSATAEGTIDKLYPWQATVDVSSLAPGTYSFVAMTDDPSGGEGGGPTEDSKTITVR